MCNCKDREIFIDPILQLEESHQGILMNIMMKYMKGEEGRKSMMQLENEILEGVQQQLKDKEADRASILDQVGKLEQENRDQSQSLADTEKKLKVAEHENQRLRGLIEELEKKSAQDVQVFEPAEDPRVHELEAELSQLKKQLDQTNDECKAKLRDAESDKARINDELFIAQQKASKLAATEKLVEQQRTQIDTLESTQSEQSGIAGKLEACEIKVQDLERSKKQLADEYKKMSTQYYDEVNRGKSNADELKTFGIRFSKMEEEIRVVEQKQKYWEQRAKQAEEKLRACTEENDSFRLTASAGSLLSQEQELKYKERIARLEEQVSLLSESSSISLTKRVGDLEGRLESTNRQKAKLDQDILLLTKRYEELQKEHSVAKDELENYKLDRSSTLDITKEYQRVKKDRDMLLEVAAKTQDISMKYDSLKRAHDDILQEHKTAKEKLETMIKEKQETDKQLQHYKVVNLDLEKKGARQEEKVTILQEERKKGEKMIQEIIQRNDQEREKRVDAEVKKEVGKSKKQCTEQVQRTAVFPR